MVADDFEIASKLTNQLIHLTNGIVFIALHERSRIVRYRIPCELEGQFWLDQKFSFQSWRKSQSGSRQLKTAQLEMIYIFPRLGNALMLCLSNRFYKM